MSASSHPPFTRTPTTPSALHDTTSKGGAEILAQRIREAWAAVGWDVEVVVEHDEGGGHVVRTPGLVAGLPGPTARRIGS